jgi:hypothetical protein
MYSLKNNKPDYMDDFYKTRERLSLKYIDMPLPDMKAEIKKSTDACIALTEEIQKKKMIENKSYYDITE